MLTTHPQLTAWRRFSWLGVFICALLMGGMLYGSDLGAASSPLTTEAPEISGAPSLISEVKLMASDGNRYDYFGQSLSIDGDIALLGAPHDDDNGLDSGAAYIFRWNGERWQEEGKLLAHDGARKDNFGQSVSINPHLVARTVLAYCGSCGICVGLQNGNDNTPLNPRTFGESGAKTPRMFGDLGGCRPLSWSFRLLSREFLKSPYCHANEPFFAATKPAPSGLLGAGLTDESTLALPLLLRVMKPKSEVKLTASDKAKPNRFGSSVSVGDDYAVVGLHDYGFGLAYFFHWDGKQWQEQQKIIPRDRAAHHYFASSVSLAGEIALIGAFGDDEYGSNSGAAYIYRWNGSQWQEESKL